MNDAHGHAAGDEVLRSPGAFLDDSLRGGDMGFRIGGEEFLAILHQTDDGAAVFGEWLLAGWRMQNPTITFSMGICLHDHTRSPEKTLDLADSALYDAKRAGRDGMVVSDESGRSAKASS